MHAAFIRSFEFSDGTVWSVCTSPNCSFASGDEWNQESHSGRWGLQQRTVTDDFYRRSHGEHGERGRQRKVSHAVELSNVSDDISPNDISPDISPDISSDDATEDDAPEDATELSCDDLITRANDHIVDEDKQLEFSIEAVMEET